MIKNCPCCKSSRIKKRDYQFMMSEICSRCGYRHDTPKAGKEAEYDAWWRAHNYRFFEDDKTRIGWNSPEEGPQ